MPAEEEDFSHLCLWTISIWQAKHSIEVTWRILVEDSGRRSFGEPTFFDHVYLGCIQRECQTSKDMWAFTDMFEFRTSAGATEATVL